MKKPAQKLLLMNVEKNCPKTKWRKRLTTSIIKHYPA
jgi:hypothetical protein